jgi:hypothetical protein
VCVCVWGRDLRGLYWMKGEEYEPETGLVVGLSRVVVWSMRARDWFVLMGCRNGGRWQERVSVRLYNGLRAGSRGFLIPVRRKSGKLITPQARVTLSAAASWGVSRGLEGSKDRKGCPSGDPRVSFGVLPSL